MIATLLVSSSPSVVSLQYLETAHFLGNPCCKAKGYRDFTVGASSDSLKMLDDLPVLRHQQIAIRGLNEHRKYVPGYLRTVDHHHHHHHHHHHRIIT